MRPQNPKRGRSRGRKGGNHHQLNRTLESNGPDVKIRGTAAHIYEKYQNLARDAHSSGDRIGAESYLQHAEHYYRLMAASQAASGVPAQPGQMQNGNGYAYDGDNDGDDGDNTDGGSSYEPRQHQAPAQVAHTHQAPPHSPRPQAAPQPSPQPAPLPQPQPQPMVADEPAQLDAAAPVEREPAPRQGRLNGRSRRLNGRTGRAIRSLETGEASAEEGAEAPSDTSVEGPEDATV